LGHAMPRVSDAGLGSELALAQSQLGEALERQAATPSGRSTW
jgi:hypothetical protein